jgi:hypothetical protein
MYLLPPPPQGLHGLFWGELYLYLLYTSTIRLTGVYYDSNTIMFESQQGSNKNYIMSSLIICTPHPILFG